MKITRDHSKYFLIRGAINRIESAAITKAISHDLSQLKIKLLLKPLFTVTKIKLMMPAVTNAMRQANFISLLVGILL